MSKTIRDFMKLGIHLQNCTCLGQIDSEGWGREVDLKKINLSLLHSEK